MQLGILKKVWLYDLVYDNRGFDLDDKLNTPILGLVIQKFINKEDRVRNPFVEARQKKKKGGRVNKAADSNGIAGGPISIGGKRVCFMWRHRVFECCGTAMIAIYLFMELYHDQTLSFLEPDQPKRKSAQQLRDVLIKRANARKNNNVSD